jgi:hypothetical protein
MVQGFSTTGGLNMEESIHYQCQIVHSLEVDREFTGFSWLEPGDEREFISHISCTPATMQEYEEYIKNGTKPMK